MVAGAPTTSSPFGNLPASFAGLGVALKQCGPKAASLSWAKSLSKFMRELGVYNSGGGNPGHQPASATR